MSRINYPQGSKDQVRSYFSTILELDKAINVEAFKLSSKMNIKCIGLLFT